MDLISSGQFLSISRTQPHTLSDNPSFTLANGTHVQVLGEGIIAFTPKALVSLDATKRDALKDKQKYILLSSGIHGNETAPIEICDKFVQDIILGKMEVRHKCLFIFGNLPSMDIEKRFVEENLNRLFEKKLIISNNERRRAQALMDAVDQFFAPSNAQDTLIHYDLHTAIRDSKNEKFLVYPYLYERDYDKSQLAFMSGCGVNTVLLSQGPTATFSHYSSKYHHAHAFTVELGKVKKFGENDMQRFEQTRLKLLDLLTNQEPTTDAFDECPIEVFEVSQEIIKQQDDFTLHFSDQLANFSEFRKGELIASEKDIQYVAKQDGEAVVFPNASVEIGQRALLTVVPRHI